MSYVVVLCGFSSAGKDKICKYLSDNYNYKMLVSYTSRPMRQNESEGSPYHFISKDKFKEMIANDEFIECREYHTLVNDIPETWYYGMHKDEVDLTKNNYI